MFTMVILARMGFDQSQGPFACELSHLGSNFRWALPAQPVGWVARRLGAQIVGLGQKPGPAAKTGPGSR